MTIIVESPSDDLAAWIGVAGVAVGVLLTTAVEWLRDRRGQTRQRQRDLHAAADELAGAAETLGWLSMSQAAGGSDASRRLDFALAMAREQARINAALVTIAQLASDELLDAAGAVKTAALEILDPDFDKSAASYHRMRDRLGELNGALFSQLVG
jgi:hypothetical protein